MLNTVTVPEIKKLIIDNYDKCLEPLNEISKDWANNKSMISRSEEFYNYDRIGESVFQGKDKPKTPDMIFFKDDTIFFVEFKSGRIEGIKKKCETRGNDDECHYVKWDIKLKALEGAFVVLHRLAAKHKEKIDFSTIVNLKKCYILVYAKDEKPGTTSGERRFGNQLSSSKVKFGLQLYKGTFFTDVATFTPDSFIKKLEDFKVIESLR